MKNELRLLTLIGVLWMSTFSLYPALAQDNKAGPSRKPVASVAEIAAEAFVYGYPLVLMDVTKKSLTAVHSPSENSAPLNQFGHHRTLPDPSLTEVVNPQVDTLYSLTWLDLSQEPQVLSLPNTRGRYFVMQLMDAYTNVFTSLGTRTTGNIAQTIAITGPGWKGTLPAEMREIHSPSHTVWIIGQTLCNRKKDYAAVHLIQDKMKITPLSAWGSLYNPPAHVAIDQSVDMKTPPVQQVARMDSLTFFRKMCVLMKLNPPNATDFSTIERFGKIGIFMHEKCDFTSVKPQRRAALEKGLKLGMRRVLTKGMSFGEDRNGWRVERKAGSYGKDYTLRAAVAMTGIGAGLQADTYYLVTGFDAQRRPFSGDKSYVLHFSAGNLPPVNAYWSLTLANHEWSLYENELNRYALGKNSPLKRNSDGSLDIYIQHNSPSERLRSNWLPAPKNRFFLSMRLYWPKEEALNGSWSPPKARWVRE